MLRFKVRYGTELFFLRITLLQSWNGTKLKVKPMSGRPGLSEATTFQMLKQALALAGLSKQLARKLSKLPQRNEFGR